MIDIDKLKTWDPSEDLENEEDIALYLQAIIEEDPDLLPAALGDVARAIGMTEVAHKTGISREALYTALSETGNPTYNTLRKVLDAYGVKLSFTVPQKKAAHKAKAKPSPSAKSKVVPA